ncbi:MAG: LON peptidase substrate-binding domain-containing protein, partial [Deltaproteobacteria bacterium]|nr:LON peptidase substrate-binding domain-containing protein [Candidatus Anaeroferrophillacea bacterium]
MNPREEQVVTEKDNRERLQDEDQQQEEDPRRDKTDSVNDDADERPAAAAPETDAAEEVETEEEEEELVIPSSLPLLPIRDVVIFPFMIMPLFVGRESSIKAVDEALANDRLIFLSTQKHVAEENPGPDDIYGVGTISMIMR